MRSIVSKIVRYFGVSQDSKFFSNKKYSKIISQEAKPLIIESSHLSEFLSNSDAYEYQIDSLNAISTYIFEKPHIS